MLNCLFGATGNPYFRYYDLRIAEGITTTGQLIIRWMERKMNEKLNKILNTDSFDYVIACDTDSVMINFGPLVKMSCDDKTVAQKVAFLEKIGSTVFAEFIQESLDELSVYLNSIEPVLRMKLENVCDRAIFVGAKNYILNVHSSEGVKFDPPELKVMGIALVKSSTPAVMRDSLRNSIPILLYETENHIQKYVKDEKHKFFDESVESIAFPRGVTDIDKWQSATELYISRTPIHVRAAIMHNHMIDELGLNAKYPYIKNGDKMKFVYLKIPNTIREDVVGFHSELPVEFGLHQYVDYNRHFDSAFTKNLETMCKPLKWNLIDRPKMDI